MAVHKYFLCHLAKQPLGLLVWITLYINYLFFFLSYATILQATHFIRNLSINIKMSFRIPKKRGPKKKKIKQEEITDHMPVKKRKRDRFNGMTEDEVMKRELPDHLEENLDIVIVR